MRNFDELLANYRTLARKVDDLCARICNDFADDIACGMGCDGCCLHFSVFMVEAVNVAIAVRQLSKETIALLRARAALTDEHGVCPLLSDGACLIYPFRPIICRTHGLPILAGDEGFKVIDYCPKNFLHAERIPGNAVIDLERLNDTLAAVNSLFVRQCFRDAPPPMARLTMVEALFLEV